MLRHLLNKVKRLFDDEQHLPSQKPNEERRTERYSSKPADPARVVYHYPKKGKFRFPLIEDQETNVEEKAPIHKQEQRRPTEQKRTESQSKKDFKWTITPSPVYGYRKQEERVEENHIERAQPEIERTFEENKTVEAEDRQVKLREEKSNLELVERGEEKKDREDRLPHLNEKRRSKEVEEQPAPKERAINRQERRRRQLDQQDTDGKRAVPFNVLMLPEDKKPQQKSEKKLIEHKSKSLYEYPSIQLLRFPEKKHTNDQEWLHQQASILEETLRSFNVEANVVHVTQGPSVTRFEIQPGKGVKVTKITGLNDDMKLALSAKDIRIEAPIPGKNTIGIEVPNRQSSPVYLRELLRRDLFIRERSPLTVALGLDISGQPIITDLQKMPHGLVAGATGSGKSVCINSMLISLLYKATPDEVKLMLIDPKMVELAPYNGLPHLVTPVITDAKQATAALKWVVEEMERRYELFSEYGVRDVMRYNDLYSESTDKPALPFMLVVIDELADLMMVSPQEVEDSICRIAQKARACGIHLLLATQRPSVDVITGLIKANIPTRIAFSVSSQTDSRTILDTGGAERLLGRGDMLFYENGSPKSIRVQGTFVSDEEIEEVVAFVKKQREPEYLLEAEQLKKVTKADDIDDDLFEEACHYVVEQGGASASSLQRKYRIGYNRAARLIDMMEDAGIVSEAMGSKPRHILVDAIQLEELLHEPKA